jgi:hypothetical protein
LLTIKTYSVFLGIFDGLAFVFILFLFANINVLLQPKMSCLSILFFLCYI